MTSDRLPFPLPHRPPAIQIRGKDTATIRAETGERTMPMRGFDPQYRDIVHYIVEITEEIWTDRNVGRIDDTYAADCLVYTSNAVVTGAKSVIASTLQTLHAQPGGETRHLNVAWSGDEDDFTDSHLGFARSTNLGPTAFGPATGRRYGIHFVADCISRDNKIHTEWLARDNLSLALQLGYDPHVVAQALAEARGDAPLPSWQRTPQQWDGPRDTLQGFWAHHFDTIWNRRNFDHIASHYAEAAVAHWPGGRTARGWRAIGDLLLGLFASMPDGSVTVEHICWSEESDGLIVAVRWQLTGSTTPLGSFGPVPKDRPVSLIGMSHFRFDGPWIVEEWTVFDQLAGLIQAYGA